MKRTPKADNGISMEDLIAQTTPAKVMSIGNSRTINDLAGMSADELMVLRSEIDSHLPSTKLVDVNLAEELVMQFQTVKYLQTKVLDSNTSAQQKAAVANSCAGALAHLVKMQTELYNAERLKAIEQILIQVMRDQPEGVQHAFFDKYERLLGG